MQKKAEEKEQNKKQMRQIENEQQNVRPKYDHISNYINKSRQKTLIKWQRLSD